MRSWLSHGPGSYDRFKVDSHGRRARPGCGSPSQSPSQSEFNPKVRPQNHESKRAGCESVAVTRTRMGICAAPLRPPPRHWHSHWSPGSRLWVPPCGSSRAARAAAAWAAGLANSADCLHCRNKGHEPSGIWTVTGRLSGGGSAAVTVSAGRRPARMPARPARQPLLVLMHPYALA